MAHPTKTSCSRRGRTSIGRRMHYCFQESANSLSIWQSDKAVQVLALQSRYHILQLQREKHPSAKAFFPLDWQWASPCSSRRYWWTPRVKLQQCFTAVKASQRAPIPLEFQAVDLLRSSSGQSVDCVGVQASFLANLSSKASSILDLCHPCFKNEIVLYEIVWVSHLNVWGTQSPCSRYSIDLLMKPLVWPSDACSPKLPTPTYLQHFQMSFL